MQRLAGRHANSVRYYYGGHVYHLDSRGGGAIFRCASRNSLSCSTRIYAENHEEIENALLEVAEDLHNHPGDELFLIKEQFWQELQLLARTTFTDLRVIYDMVKDQER